MNRTFFCFQRHPVRVQRQQASDDQPDAARGQTFVGLLQKKRNTRKKVVQGSFRLLF